MVAATVRFDAPKSGKKSVRKSKGESGRQDACPTNGKQPWMPSERERIIFRWVKFDGERQSWVADQYGISQSTVSRIVQRYERWIARGGEQQEGAPSHDERLRAQKWLTYERNEWILCSALRIAAEMERHYETSKSTITSDSPSHTGQREVRTENKEIDRTGIAARFLRLAYRINMDQLRLVEAGPLPALEPLAVDEAAVADRAEMQASEEKAEREAEERHQRHMEEDRLAWLEFERQEKAKRETERETADGADRMTNDQAPMTDGEIRPVASDHSSKQQHNEAADTGKRDAYPTSGVHKMHNDAGVLAGLNADGASPSGQNGRPKKSGAYAYPDAGETPVPLMPVAVSP